MSRPTQHKCMAPLIVGLLALGPVVGPAAASIERGHRQRRPGVDTGWRVKEVAKDRLNGHDIRVDCPLKVEGHADGLVLHAFHPRTSRSERRYIKAVLPFGARINAGPLHGWYIPHQRSLNQAIEAMTRRYHVPLDAWSLVRHAVEGALSVTAEQGARLGVGIVFEQAIRALVANAPDPHTAYLTPRESRAFEARAAHGKTVGVGINGHFSADGLVVTSVIAGSPAEDLVQPGDVIERLNGQHLPPSRQLYEQLNRVGNSQLLRLRRSGQTHEVQVRPMDYQVRSVTLTPLGDGIVTARIQDMAQGTTDELRTGLQSLRPINGIIVRKNSNGGGLSNEAPQMASLLGCRAATLHEVRGEHGEGRISRYRVSAEDSQLAAIPKVVIVDRGTASSAEVAAYLLHSLGISRTPLVGEQTLGKWLSQATHRLPNGSTLKFSTSRVMIETSRTSHIPRGPLIPDVSVEQARMDLERSGVNCASMHTSAVVEKWADQYLRRLLHH